MSTKIEIAAALHELGVKVDINSTSKKELEELLFKTKREEEAGKADVVEEPVTEEVEAEVVEEVKEETVVEIKPNPAVLDNSLERLKVSSEELQKLQEGNKLVGYDMKTQEAIIRKGGTK